MLGFVVEEEVADSMLVILNGVYDEHLDRPCVDVLMLCQICSTKRQLCHTV